ncbi:pyridoxamine 5'-phosphate oxidase family protein [Roseibium sp.]|uniref:pyridoxamine 5'-phosphate oxidase family protein n=1 Tax=Roseibium sp. TaxID=1936156 RepID=UPI003A981253
MSSPMDQEKTAFHVGEIAVQERAHGSGPGWRRAVSRVFRDTMPDQHRAFFENQSVLFLGLLDRKGCVWATPAFGETGFVRSPDARTLRVNAVPALHYELAFDMGEGAKIGVLGLELHSRRRNRLNGEIVKSGTDGFDIAVGQSFGNCPQYIQARAFDRQDRLTEPMEITHLDGLTEEVQALVERADTFFIASRVPEMTDDPRDGVDVSHRGGRPGFLGVTGKSTLSFPDFNGNRFFNTLGNIEADGRVGLYVPEFETGEALFVTGRAVIDWSPDRAGTFAGAGRIVDVTPEEILYVRNVFPAGGRLLEAWPGLETTGTWGEARGCGG